MGFKNEEAIKAKIVECHKQGICDSDGNSIKVTNAAGRQVFIAKPRLGRSGVKVYVYKDGKRILKE